MAVSVASCQKDARPVFVGHAGREDDRVALVAGVDDPEEQVRPSLVHVEGSPASVDHQSRGAT